MVPMRSGVMSSQRKTLWRCPSCGRQFAKRSQWHSCRRLPIDHHFRGKDPQLRKTYEMLIAPLRRLGPLRIDAVKSSINLVSRYHFGGISVRKDYLRLGFLSDRTIEDPRILGRERLGPHRLIHSVIVHSPDEVDDLLLSWLQRAYTLQSE